MTTTIRRLRILEAAFRSLLPPRPTEPLNLDALSDADRQRLAPYAIHILSACAYPVFACTLRPHSGLTSYLYRDGEQPMKRLSGTILLVIVLAVFAVWATAPNGVSIAQDTNDARISDLETRVANLELTVYGQATPVQLQATPNPGGKTIEGSGTNLSESFSLPEGQYRVEIAYTIVASSDFVNIEIVGGGGQTRSIFSTAEGPGDWHSSSLANLGGGNYFLQVTAANDTTWRVTFSPL
ncbi:MAG: hypothetical protein ACR2OE_03240 [Thermomicrobiales bacterium]